MKNLNETNLLKALNTQPRLAFELIKALGKASEDLMIYERINSRPDRELARQSKLGEAIKFSNKVVGVVSRMERETGWTIIKNICIMTAKNWNSCRIWTISLTSSMQSRKKKQLTMFKIIAPRMFILRAIFL